MYDVLVAVNDDEDRAMAQARAVADLPRAPEEVRATLLHVFTDNPEGASVHRIAAVRRAQERLEDAGVAVELAESSGSPAEEITDAASEADADLIAVSGRQRTPAGKAVFGSVGQAVMLEADRPVVLCPAVEESGK